jgi:hypothetical protein
MSHRSADPSTGPPGIPFPSFAFFRFFRPNRLFHVLTRSGFAEKNAKDAKAVASIQQRRSGLGLATTYLGFQRGGLYGVARGCPSWFHAAQRVQPLPGLRSFFGIQPGVASHPGLSLLNSSGVGMEGAVPDGYARLSIPFLGRCRDAPTRGSWRQAGGAGRAWGPGSTGRDGLGRFRGSWNREQI